MVAQGGRGRGHAAAQGEILRALLNYILKNRFATPYVSIQKLESVIKF